MTPLTNPQDVLQILIRIYIEMYRAHSVFSPVLLLFLKNVNIKHIIAHFCYLVRHLLFSANKCTDFNNFF